MPSSIDSLKSFGAEAPFIYEVLAKNYLAMLAGDYEYELVKAHLLDYPEFTSQTQIAQHHLHILLNPEQFC